MAHCLTGIINVQADVRLARVPPQVDAFIQDPLTFKGKVRVCTAAATLQAFAVARAKRHLLQLPVFAHHGTMDKVTSLPVRLNTVLAEAASTLRWL